MGKFDFSQYANSNYMRLWRSGTDKKKPFLQIVVDDPRFYRANFEFWKEKFKVDSDFTPSHNGAALFEVEERKIEPSIAMSWRAPMAGTKPTERGGASKYSGSIPDFISEGFYETTLERVEKLQVIDMLGERGDAQLVKSYVDDWLNRVRNGANMTLSNMAAQMLSKGQIDYTLGMGIKDKVIKADIPTDNFLKAGQVAWTDTENCRLLDQWRKMVDDATDRYGIDIDWILEVKRDVFDAYICQNKQIIEQVRLANASFGVLLPEIAQITDEMVMDMLSKYKGIPKLVIIDEKQNDIHQGIVQGWAENTAVMRPSGYAGVVKHTTNLDKYMYENFANELTKCSFAVTNDGLLTIMNSIVPDGDFQAFMSKAMMQAVPVLDEFLYHNIINIAEADA